MTDSKSTKEEFKVSGEELLGKVKEIIREGNARRLIIKDKSGKTMIEIPLTAGVTAGVVGIVIAPVLAAVGAIAALITECTILVERTEEKK